MHDLRQLDKELPMYTGCKIYFWESLKQVQFPNTNYLRNCEITIFLVNMNLEEIEHALNVCSLHIQ